jgi:hypothetical protein
MDLTDFRQGNLIEVIIYLLPCKKDMKINLLPRFYVNVSFEFLPIVFKISILLVSR